jgi:hypothetical protein
MSPTSREELRKNRELRVVAGDEEGGDVFRLPNGLYGFTYSPAYKEMPIYAKKPLHAFEVHRLKDGTVHMVGYVTPEVLQKIEAKTGMVEAILYPDPFQNATALVSLSLDDMQPAKKAISREEGFPLKTLVYAE